MYTILSNYSIFICAIVTIGIILSILNKLKNTNNVSNVNLSWLWKIGFLILIIGIGVLVLNINNIYDHIDEKSEKAFVAKEVKKSIVFSFYYILLFFVSIIAWFSLKKYRQHLFNLKSTNE